MLSTRKKKILCAVVDGYIQSALPISSKEIQCNSCNDCSSATIRNELSALESMGYLLQPYVSAGRVPSHKAYRMYVDELMQEDSLTRSDIEAINGHFSSKIDSVEEVISRVAEVISDITNYTAVVVKEDLTDTITNIKLVDLGNGKLLVVIVTSARLLKDGIIDLPEDFTPAMVEASENWLNRLFVGKQISQFINYQYPMALVNDQFKGLNTLFKKIVDVLKKVSLFNGMEVATQGIDKMYLHNEYKDVNSARNFMATVADRQQLLEIFGEYDYDDESVNIKIGADDNMPEGCSAVTTRVALGNNVVGNVGVIGPVRMNYKKVVAVLQTLSAILEEFIKE